MWTKTVGYLALGVAVVIVAFVIYRNSDRCYTIHRATNRNVLQAHHCESLTDALKLYRFQFFATHLELVFH